MIGASAEQQTRCVVCGTASERCGAKWAELSIVECPSCKHVFWNQTLRREQLLELYGLSYFKGEEYSDYEEDRHLIQRNFRGNAAKIRAYKTSGRLLEIGSAFGYFLDLMRSDFTVTGYEVCKEAADYAKNNLGLDVICGSFLEDSIDDEFDVVCMWDVIEHLERPDLVLEKLVRHLRPGGHLFLSTGDISALIPRLRGPKWRLVHPPTHIHYFSRETIRRLLGNYGLEVVNLDYPGSWRSLHQLFTSVFGMRNAKKLIPGAFYLNLFDIMRVTARKPLELGTSAGADGEVSRLESAGLKLDPPAESG